MRSRRIARGFGSGSDMASAAALALKPGCGLRSNIPPSPVSKYSRPNDPYMPMFDVEWAVADRLASQPIGDA